MDMTAPRQRAARLLVAPPGTRIGEPGWVKPSGRWVFRWGINGERPSVAVQRDGVLLSTGLPWTAFPSWPQPANLFGISPNTMTKWTAAGFVHVSRPDGTRPLVSRDEVRRVLALLLEQKS